MFRTRRLSAMLLALTLLASAAGNPLSQSSALAHAFATAPVLGGSAGYSVLAGSLVTSTGPTTISGAVGVSPSIGVPPHVIGFPPGLVLAPSVIHDADAHAAAAQADNTTAFATLDQPCDVTYSGVQDLTLVSPLGPGVYCAVSFALTGNLSLAGAGVWIFKSASTLITSPSSSVTAADPCSVWWRVGSSATLDTNTAFIGNILALTSITLNTGATLNGRALAQTGAVTLGGNTISRTCATSPTATPVNTVPAGTATPINTLPAGTPTPVNTLPAGTPTPVNTVPAGTATPVNTLPANTLTPVNTPTLPANLTPTRVGPTNDEESPELAPPQPLFLPVVLR